MKLTPSSFAADRALISPSADARLCRVEDVGAECQAAAVPDRFPLPWPRFELVSVSGEHLPRSMAERYPTVEVPGERSVGGCRPVELRLLTMPDGLDLIQFGELPSGERCASTL